MSKKNRLVLTRKQVLNATTDVKGQRVTFQTALLVLAEYPLKSKEKYALFRIRKQVDAAIKEHTEFVQEQLKACQGTPMPNGSISFEGADQAEQEENAKTFEESVNASNEGEFEIYLDHKIEIDEIKDGTFDKPKGTAQQLSLPEIEMLEPILAMPDDSDGQADDPIVGKASR